MTDQFDFDAGNNGGALEGSSSFSQPNFNESEAIASLKGALTKQQQLKASSARATADVKASSANAVEQTAAASPDKAQILENLSPVEQDLFNRLGGSVARAEQLNEDLRLEEGPDVFGSVQTGGVRLFGQVLNAPEIARIQGNVGNLTSQELETLNQYHTYELASEQLNKAISQVVERTDLDPFQRELARGALQKELDTLQEPAGLDEPRRFVAGQDPRRNALTTTTLRETYGKINADIAEVKATEKALEQYKADSDPIFKRKLQEENIQNTAEATQQLEKGSEQFEKGEYLDGVSNIIGGAVRTLGGTVEAAMDNPEAVLEIASETAPQLVSAFNPYTRALTNSAYVGDVFKEALNEYQEENAGALPDGENYSRMALASLGAGILEVAADKVLVGGTGKLKDAVDPAVKAAIAGAANNKFVTNAVSRMGTRVGAAGVTEGITEGGQTALEEVAKGNEVNAEDVTLGAVIGAAAGGGIAGAAQTVTETAHATKTASEKVADVASQAKDQLSKSPEERLVRDAQKVLRKKPENRKPEEKKEVQKAKVTIEQAEARLELFRKTPGITPETIAAQEKVVNSLKTRGSEVVNQKADKAVFESAPEDVSVDDYIEEVSYQIALDDDGELNENDIQKAIDNAVAKGATDEQVKNLQVIKEAKKTSAEVSDNILSGNDEWRGAGTYLSRIMAAQEAGNEEAAAYNATEILRFSDYIDTKVEAFRQAQAEAKRLGRSVLVLNPVDSARFDEDIPYESLDGKPMYATGDQRTATLLETMAKDATLLAGYAQDALDIWTGQESPEAVVQGVIDENVDADTLAAEDTDVLPDEEETVTDEVSEPVEEPQFAANTQAVEQELDNVLVSSERIRNFSSVETPDSDSLRSSDSVVTSQEEVSISSLPESGDVVARAANSTQSPGVKRAVRELGKAIAYKERDGVLIEPLDSSIDEKHYTAALDLIRQALADKDFGKQLKTKGIGQEQVEAMSDLYFLPDETDADAVYRSKNEFKEEVKVEGFTSDTPLTRQVVFGRGIQLGIGTDKATKVAKIFEHARQAFAPMLDKQFQLQMSKVKDPGYAKFNSEFASNFADAAGNMVAFMRKGMTLATAEYIMNNASTEQTVTTSQVQQFGNLDSKAEVPAKLMQLAIETGIGDTRASVVEALGTNAMNIAGVKFNGAHANTRSRHISAAGNIIFRALVDAGIITSKRVSVNRLAWAGGEYDTKPLVDKLKAQAAKQDFNVYEADSWPGYKFRGKYMVYNGIVYEWGGRSYKVYDNTSQGNYIETFYVDPEADIRGMDIATYLDNVKGASVPFSKVFGSDYASRVPAMHTPRKNKGNIKGYAHKKLNKTQKSAQDKQSEQKLYLDKGIMRIKEIFGDQRIMRVAGWKAYDKDTTNKVVALSREGKNQTVKADMDGWNNFLLDMQTEADQFGIGDVGDIPFFANFFNSAYQRQFVDSQTFNYQSSKAMHRFAAHHGEQTFDMTDVGQQVAFLVSVAQGMGISADKLSSATTVSKLDQLVEEHAAVVGLMQKFENNQDLTEAQMDEIVDFAASEENMHTLLALREYARYRNALEAEQTSLQVVMPIELDGVNNGPVTAILQSLTGDMDFAAYLRRAGITIASEDTRTSAERYEDKPDGLYEEGAEAVQTYVTATIDALRDTDNLGALGVLRAQIILKALTPKNVKLDKSLEIKRNETKGLITKMFYNAGDASLLRAEVGEVVANFYGELQKVIDGDSSMGLERLVWVLAQAATNPQPDRYKDALDEATWKANATKLYSQLLAQMDTPEKLINFELSFDIQAQLTDNMKADYSYGRSKLEAIRNTYRSAVDQSQVVSQMTSVGAVFARQRIDSAMKLKREELGLSRFEELPEKEIEKIYSELGEQLPNLKLDMHTAEDMSDAIPLYSYDSQGRDKASVNKYALKANNANAPLYVTGREITDVGAGGVAASTISVADASTIFGIMEQMNEGFMTVFDGVLVNGLRMDVLAQAANASYAKSLRNNNTFQKIYQNYQSVVDEGIGFLNQEFYEELLDALRIKPEKRLDMDYVQFVFEQVMNNAEAINDGIRKNAALGTHDLSVDQFGAVNDRTTTIAADGTVKDAFEELDPLNPDKDYYDKVESDSPLDTEINTRLPNSATLAGFVNRNWARSAVFNRRGTRTRLLNLIKQAGVENSEYADFLREGLIDQILLPAFEAIGSTPRIRAVDNATMQEEVGHPARGAYRYKDNTIFLNTDKAGANVETVFHELVHAALDIALVNSGRASKRYAADIEALAQEAKVFLEQNQDLVTRFTPDGIVTEGVNRHIPWVKKDGSINTREFLSWSLTNYNIITQLAQAKSESNPRGLFGRIWNFIRRLLNKFTFKGNRIQEDSIFSFLFTTAAELAPKAQAPKQGQKGKSLQEEYADINNADPVQTFDDLAAISTLTDSSYQHIHDVYTREIMPLMEETRYEFLNSHANTMERLNELKDAGTDVRLDNFKGSFNMSPVEEHVFQLYRVAMVEALKNNDARARELSELYRSAKTNLTPDDFGPNGQAQYDAVFVNHGSPKAQLDRTSAGIEHQYNRSEYLASFIALARVNPTMRAALEKSFVRRPDKAKPREDFEVWAIETGTDFFKEMVFSRATGTQGQRSYKERVDTLSKKMAVADQIGKSQLERVRDKAFQKLDYGYGLYKKAFEKGMGALLHNSITKALVRAAKPVGQAVVKAATNRDAAAIDELHQSLAHGVMAWLPRMVQDLRPTDESNRAFRRLSIGKTRAIAGARDGKTKAVKQSLTELLGELTKRKHEALTEVLLDSDMGALMAAGWDAQRVGQMLKSERKLNEEINALRDELAGKSNDYANFYVRSAFSLGTLIGTGQASEAFTLPNAHAIANYKETGKKGPSESVESLIDQLATLVALKHQSALSKDLAAEVLADAHVFNALAQTFAIYQADVLEHRYEGYQMLTLKGGFNETYNSFKDMKMVKKEDLNKFTASNYSLHRVVKKDLGDGNPQTLYLVSSSTGGLGEYQQGLYSTINAAQSGIKNLDGRTTFNGYDDYSEMKEFSKLTKALKRKEAAQMFDAQEPSLIPDEYLVPVLNQNGVPTGFQYTLSRTERENVLGRDKNFIDALSQSFGRTVEAEGTERFNNEINQKLVEAYNAARARGDTSSFIEISKDAPTKRGREAYRMMPPAARENLSKTWGGQVAAVHSSLFDVVYGYRKATIANVLRKNIDDDTRSLWVKKLGQALTLDYKLEKPLVNAVLHGEKFLTEASHTIKDLIVIRGLRVMLGNMISNTVQLVLQEDMPLRTAIKLQLEGMREARRYQGAAAKIRRLKFEVEVEENERKKALMYSRITELEEELAKNKARHLIDHGLLTAIVEDVEEDTNPFSYANQLANKVSGFTNQLPKAVRSTTNALMVNRDSEVYKSLYMFTQLGDFSSRYAALQYRTQENGEVTANDIDEVVDAFVNYDLPANKYLQYLGDVGQLWFFKYFFRIQNVIIRNSIRNPRRVLEFLALSSISPISISTYFDAFFLFNSITNKMGFFNYAELGAESLPVVQVYDFLTK